MTRNPRDSHLAAPTRFIVRVLDEDTGEVANRVETKDIPALARGTKLGDLVLFVSQEDGGLWAVSLGLVKDIREERKNHNGDWVLHAVHDPQTLGQPRK